MCKECRDWKEKFFAESFNLTNLFTKKQNHFVEDGEAYSYKGYDILVTKEHVYINKLDRDIARLEHNSFNLKIIKQGIDSNNIEILNTIQEKTRKYKTWRAILDDRTCNFCPVLNGQEKVEWALFFVNIKGKTYSLKGPPLHWVFNKSGQKIITCRCRLEWNNKRITDDEVKKDEKNKTSETEKKAADKKAADKKAADKKAEDSSDKSKSTEKEDESKTEDN
jgi:hypothetical protein